MSYAHYDHIKGAKTIKNNFFRGLLALTVLSFGIAALIGAGAAKAATSYSLFGDASIVPLGNPGNAAQLRSDVSNIDGYGGVLVTPSAPIAWADLTTLSTDFNVTDDDCGGGSPRVQVRIDTNNDGVSDGSVRIALGPSPNFTECAAGWQNSGNLIGNSDTGRYDYSVFGGSPYTTYVNAPAIVTSGKVVGVTVVVDGSWSADATNGDSEQTILVDNITVNNDVTTFDAPAYNTPATSDQCKKDGWKNFTDNSGRKFKNQGDCVSYVATKGKNLANGAI